MAANTAPIFTKNGRIESTLVTAANTSSQGGGTIGTDIFKAATAGADGAFVEKVSFIATATAPTSTTATVARVFRSTVASGSTTSADTALLAEIALPSVAADNASTANSTFEIPLNTRIASGATILVTTHHAPAANTAWRANVHIGDF